MKNLRLGTVLAVLVPIVVAAYGGWQVSNQMERKRVAEAEENRLRTNNNAIRSLIKQHQVQLVANKVIAAQSSPEEQAAFLTQMRVNAAAAGVKLVRYNNRGLVIPPRRTNDPKAQNEAPQLFKPVASNVEVSGPFEAVRGFAYSLLRANRLLNMSGVTWKRDNDKGTTTLSFTLIRYVTDQPMPEPTPTVASSGALGEAAN